MKISIENGRLFDPASGLDDHGDLFVAGGRIVGIFAAPDGFTGDLVIDARNKVVLPGIVDLSARLKASGISGAAVGLQTELYAASSSGITSLCYPPDKDFVIEAPAVVESICRSAKDCHIANVYPLGALIQGLKGERLAEMYALKKAGCIGASNAHAPLKDMAVLRHALEYAKSCALTVFLHAEDVALKHNGLVHEGVVSTRLGLPASLETTETVALSASLLLAEQAGARVHFCRLSSARGVQLVRAAQQSGLPVTADVAICQLHLTEMDVMDYNSNCHLQPPLRSEHDRKGLIEGVKDGTLAAVCSDHKPHAGDAKAAPFGLTAPGAATVEHLLPLMLHLVNRGELEFEQAIAALTLRPAEVLGIDRGTLGIGKTADICILDLGRGLYVDRACLLSAGKNSPFNGWALEGVVSHTLYNGAPVFTKEPS